MPAAVAAAPPAVTAEAGAGASISSPTELPTDALRDLVLPLFANLTQSQLSDLLTKAAITTYQDGDLIMEQGEIGRRFFLVLSGAAAGRSSSLRGQHHPRSLRALSGVGGRVGGGGGWGGGGVARLRGETCRGVTPSPPHTHTH